jgi:hypothetical protein
LAWVRAAHGNKCGKRNWRRRREMCDMLGVGVGKIEDLGMVSFDSMGMEL